MALLEISETGAPKPIEDEKVDAELRKMIAEDEKALAEYRNIVQGREIDNFWGHRVLESRTTGGDLVAVKVSEKGILRRSEVDMLRYAAENGICAPRVRGCYDLERRVRVMVTDRVPGQSLDKVWHSLSRKERTSIKLQLKEQIRLMRKCTQPYIGRINHQKTKNFFDRLGDNSMGPFDSEEAFDEWCLARVTSVRRSPMGHAFWKRRLPKMRQNSRFVLTHGDLAARNIMVHEGRITGIVDWEYSGFFPEYMEYAVATVIHDCIEDWWVPVLKEVLEPCGFMRSRFIATIKNRGW